MSRYNVRFENLTAEQMAAIITTSTAFKAVEPSVEVIGSVKLEYGVCSGFSWGSDHSVTVKFNDGADPEEVLADVRSIVVASIKPAAPVDAE